MKKLYFCPFCKVFFKDEEDYEGDGKKRCDYKCFDCSKCFNIKTYSKEARSSSKFHFSNDNIDEDEVKKHIQYIILDLYRRGYSQRKIYSITHFPKGRIEEVTKKRVGERLITKKVFLLEYLQMGEKEYRLLAKKKRSWYLDPEVEDIINREVVKALNFGCTYEEIAELFKISNRRIKELKKNADKEVKRKYKMNFVDSSNKIQIKEI